MRRAASREPSDPRPSPRVAALPSRDDESQCVRALSCSLFGFYMTQGTTHSTEDYYYYDNIHTRTKGVLYFIHD